MLLLSSKIRKKIFFCCDQILLYYIKHIVCINCFTIYSIYMHIPIYNYLWYVNTHTQLCTKPVKIVSFTTHTLTHAYIFCLHNHNHLLLFFALVALRWGKGQAMREKHTQYTHTYILPHIQTEFVYCWAPSAGYYYNKHNDNNNRRSRRTSDA